MGLAPVKKKEKKIFGGMSSEVEINLVLSSRWPGCEFANALPSAVFAYTVLIWLRNVQMFWFGLSSIIKRKYAVQHNTLMSLHTVLQFRFA